MDAAERRRNTPDSDGRRAGRRGLRGKAQELGRGSLLGRGRHRRRRRGLHVRRDGRRGRRGSRAVADEPAVLMPVRRAFGDGAGDRQAVVISARCGGKTLQVGGRVEVNALAVLDAGDVGRRGRVDPRGRVTEQHDDGDRRSGDASSCMRRSAAHGQTGSREAPTRQVTGLPLSMVRATPPPSVNEASRCIRARRRASARRRETAVRTRPEGVKTTRYPRNAIRNDPSCNNRGAGYSHGHLQPAGFRIGRTG